jgi:hypothetical protein
MNKLFWNGSLFLFLHFFIKPRNVHLRTFTSDKISDGCCLFTKVDKTTISLINRETGTDSSRLNLNSFGVDNFAGWNGTFKNDIAFRAWVEGYALQLPFDLNRCIFTFIAIDNKMRMSDDDCLRLKWKRWTVK